MAMEMHALQPRLTEAADGVRVADATADGLRRPPRREDDVPADVKASFDAFKKDLEALAPRLAAPQGGRGGGGGGRGKNESLAAKLGQAKNGLTARHVARRADAFGPIPR